MGAGGSAGSGRQPDRGSPPHLDADRRPATVRLRGTPALPARDARRRGRGGGGGRRQDGGGRSSPPPATATATPPATPPRPGRAAGDARRRGESRRVRGAEAPGEGGDLTPPRTGAGGLGGGRPAGHGPRRAEASFANGAGRSRPAPGDEGGAAGCGPGAGDGRAPPPRGPFAPSWPSSRPAGRAGAPARPRRTGRWGENSGERPGSLGAAAAFLR